MLETLADRVTEDCLIQLLWDRKTDKSEIHLVTEYGTRVITDLDRESASTMFRHPWTIDLRLTSRVESGKLEL